MRIVDWLIQKFSKRRKHSTDITTRSGSAEGNSEFIEMAGLKIKKTDFEKIMGDLKNKK